MGQYYYPIILDDDGNIVAWMNAHEYNNGLKLMEHSYIGNNFVSTFEFMLCPEGEYYKSRVVWAGDYADVEPDSENLHHLCQEEQCVRPSEMRTIQYPYIVNHSKKQFVDKAKVPEKEGNRIHPLSILTCEGNGRGYGDFRGQHELIGYWARDVISMHFKRPVGFIEVLFDLVED